MTKRADCIMQTPHVFLPAGLPAVFYLIFLSFLILKTARLQIPLIPK